MATLLELMRYFSERKDALENSVYFLFTDSEEPNMYGSLLESKNTELMNKVNLVINVEARGMNGAVYMFETSLKNNKVIKLFRKAESPVTYSVAPAVYSVMTNYTDFTNFLAAGKNGLNFSTLNDINDYHVPSDCYANVNTATVQHYGEQLLPIVEEYVSDTVYSDMNYFDGTHDAVFFNFLPEVFVSYSSVTAVVLAVCVLLALTALIVVGALKKQFDFKSWGKYIGFVLIGLAIAVAVGMVVSLVTARLNGYPWSLVNVRSACSDWILVLTAGAIFAVLHFAAKHLLRSDGLRMFNFAAVTVQAILNLIVAIALSGASFLFLIPALAGVIYLAAEHFVKNVWGKRTVAYLSLFCIVCIFVPLIFSLQYALTIGGLRRLPR
ncbi:MAG: M28 family peptidase [Christensenellales bacterium]